jgi:prepilin-type N-terminal cleavage/methylation domain-containing protein
LKKHAKQGLTLIETMLAIAILGLGLVILIAAAARGVKVAKKSQEYEVARKLLSYLDLHEPLQLDDLEEDSQSGDFPRPYERYEWTREIILAGVEEDEMYKITTQVLWPTTKGKKAETVVTLLHLPTAKRIGFIDEDAEGRELDE